MENVEATILAGSNQMAIRRIESDIELKLHVAALSVGIDKAGKRVLSEWSVMNFRKVPIWIGFLGDEPVSFHASHFGTRKRDVWTPYMNFYTAFTRIDLRRQGYARQMYQYARDLAREKGCLRVKSIAGTVMGLRFHQGMGDHIWAWNDKQMIVTDTPLVDASRFPPDTTPISVRKWTSRTQPMNQEEIEEVATKGGFWYDR